MKQADKARSLKRLVMPRPVKARMTRHLAGGEWLQAAPGDRSAAAVMLVPVGEWTLIKRESEMFRAMARELSEPWKGKITGLSPKAEELVKRRNAKRHNAEAELRAQQNNESKGK